MAPDSRRRNPRPSGTWPRLPTHGLSSDSRAIDRCRSPPDRPNSPRGGAMRWACPLLKSKPDRVSPIIPKLYLRPSAGVSGRLTWSGQANLLTDQHSTLLRQVAHSTNAMQAGCCFKGTPKRVASRSLSQCARLRRTRHTIERRRSGFSQHEGFQPTSCRSGRGEARSSRARPRLKLCARPFEPPIYERRRQRCRPQA